MGDASAALPLITARLIEINYEDVHRAASYRPPNLLITCSDFNYKPRTFQFVFIFTLFKFTAVIKSIKKHRFLLQRHNNAIKSQRLAYRKSVMK